MCIGCEFFRATGLQCFLLAVLAQFSLPFCLPWLHGINIHPNSHQAPWPLGSWLPQLFLSHSLLQLLLRMCRTPLPRSLMGLRIQPSRLLNLPSLFVSLTGTSSSLTLLFYPSRSPLSCPSGQACQFHSFSFHFYLSQYSKIPRLLVRLS